MGRARVGNVLRSGRAALIAGGTYLLVVSLLPLVDLMRLGDAGVVGSRIAPYRNAILWDFLMLSLIPAIVLVVAGSRIGRRPGPEIAADHLLRVSASVVSVYLLAGSLVSIADPSATATAIITSAAATCAALVGLVALVGWSRPATPADVPA
jgi:hypothetical protein